MPDPIESPEDFFQLRMLVLIECPNGHFHQVVFDKEQYKNVSTTVSAQFPQIFPSELDDEYTAVDMKIATREISPAAFEGTESAYEEGSIELLDHDDDND